MPSDLPNSIRQSFQWRSWLSSTSLAIVFATILTLAIGWFGLSAIDKMSTTSLQSRLNSEVDTCVLALETWLDDQRRVAQSWASDTDLRADIVAFINSPLNKNWNKDSVLASNELRELRKRLAPVCDVHGYVGFVVIDRSGRQVASLLDDALGVTLQGAPLETIRRSWQGDSVITLPFMSSIALPNENGMLQTQQTTMLVAAPVLDSSGKAVAALAFRLRTSNQFARALETARPGESAETYAFNKDGLLLSDSRFNDQLRKLGLISNAPNSRAILELELRDPGGDMLRGFRPTAPRDQWPLTRMAANAVQGKSDVYTSGYRDYRGTMVVGAWRWIHKYEFGVAREIDYAEAYQPLVAIRNIFLSWLGLFAGALLISILLHRRRQQAEQSRIRTQAAFSNLTNRFQVVLDSATQVSIIATDSSGIITVFNSGAERMLQYRADEMVGVQSPAVIHLESEVREHGEQLSREFNRPIQGFDVFVEYARQGRFEEHEWTYVRKDGSHVRVNLVVTALKDSFGNMAGFLGIAKDITESKRIEEELRHERFLLHTLMENLPDSIYFKDSQSRFLRISKALTNRFGISDPQAAVGKTDYDYFTKEHAERAQSDEQELMQSLNPVIEKEERETWPDGRRTWVSTSKFPLRDEAGQVVGTFGISRDITERKLADERFRMVVEASLNALLIFDQNGKILLVNSQAEKLFAYSRDELLGQALEILVPASYRGALPRLTANYFRNPDAKNKAGRDLQGVRKDGSLVSIELGLSRLEAEDGVYALASIIDITPRKTLEESLRAAKLAAEATSRAKSDFLANMSHEIRTPMNAIIGMTELVLGTELPTMQREYLTMVLESGESLLAIINEILDFSKFEAGKLKLEHVDFSIWDVIGDAAKSLALRAHSKGLELAYHITKDVPEMLVSDPVRLRQIVVNLVGNAIKFTEHGEILISVTCEEQNEDAVKLRFAVKDTGMGIAKDKQKLIFDAFTQADTSTTRRFGGTGLGLAISSRLVSLFGGELLLDSELGQGSIFWFSVWMTRSKQSHTPAHLSSDFLRGTTVLIVDDNATNRHIVQEMIIGWGMIPMVAASGEEAIQLLQTNVNSVPLMLTDMHMPHMDGVMLVEQIRNIAKLNDLRIIVLSSGDPSGASDRWEKLGVASRLMKPIKQSELLTAIEDALSVRQRSTEYVEEKPKETLPPVPSLRILLAEDGITNQKLAVALLQKWGHVVTVANDGRQAVHAYESQSFDLILMDVQMPEMDGMEATACIRTLEKKTGHHTPIVAMTARAMKGDREQCLQAGMDGYVSKPVRQRELYQAISDFFLK